MEGPGFSGRSSVLSGSVVLFSAYHQKENAQQIFRISMRSHIRMQDKMLFHTQICLESRRLQLCPFGTPFICMPCDAAVCLEGKAAQAVEHVLAT